MKWPVRAILPAGIFSLSLLAAVVVVSNAHLGVIRLVVVLAFLSVAPGGAFLNLLVPDLADWPTTLLLTVGASLALDVASTQTALWAHAWDPTAMIGVLAAVTAGLSGLSLVRLQLSPMAPLAPTIRLPAWSHRAVYWPLVAMPFVALFAGLGIDFAAGHPKKAVTGVPGAVAAGLATAAVVFLVFGASSLETSERRRQGLVASSLLVALVVAVVTARFVIIG